MDFCVSQYLCNNVKSFKDIELMYIDFITAMDQTIQTEQIDIVLLIFLFGKIIKLQNVVLARKCNLNLILLG